MDSFGALFRPGQEQNARGVLLEVVTNVQLGSSFHAVSNLGQDWQTLCDAVPDASSSYGNDWYDREGMINEIMSRHISCIRCISQNSDRPKIAEETLPGFFF